MRDTSVFHGKTAKYMTLGCKLNFSETAAFLRTLYNIGVREAQEGDSADICLINTCSVTEMSEHKCRQQIHKMVRENPNAVVVVTGCYAQLRGNEIAHIPGVDLVLGSNEKAYLVDYLIPAMKAHESGMATYKTTEACSALHHAEKTKDINSFQLSCSRGNRTRYFLKVQDGCNYFCTYCTIPFARGFSRNPSVDTLVKQVRQAVREGGKEVVLTGVNIGDFGRTTGEHFIDLVRSLDEIEGIRRYRISSLEPDLLTDELIEFCAHSSKFMPHFHIPLQSGSDTVLRLMHRRYDAALFSHKVRLIKEKMPNAFIGVDVMVGCRGETQECFNESRDFIAGLEITQLHVFPYSERPGTAALNIPYIVDEKEKKRRVRELLTLSETKTQAFYTRHMGTCQEVLFEKSPNGKPMHGFTRNYVRVELPVNLAEPAFDNELFNVNLGGFNADRTALIAEKIFKS